MPKIVFGLTTCCEDQPTPTELYEKATEVFESKCATRSTLILDTTNLYARSYTSALFLVSATDDMDLKQRLVQYMKYTMLRLLENKIEPIPVLQDMWFESIPNVFGGMADVVELGLPDELPLIGASSHSVVCLGTTGEDLKRRLFAEKLTV